ncbi:MAG: DnaB-like helicase C-terminal domain-containing protein [Myxococcota bacterium]|nr:DnaB-like helicase C-terminal domain-containing protein [Myxococcota bacterium]
MREGDGCQVRLGFGELGEAVGELAPGSLVVVGARPSTGKSALCLRIVATAAHAGTRAEILSLSDPPETWATRELARASNASATNLRLGGPLGESELSRIGAAASGAHDLWRVADCRSTRDLATIVAHMRRSALRHRPRVFVLDYIQLVRVRGARERRRELERAVATLKSAAAELGAVMVIASQLRRHDGHPTIEEAGSIEAAAELVLLLHRVRDPEAGDRVYAEIAKHNSGAGGHVGDVYELGWDSRSATFLGARLVGPWWRVPGVQRRPRRAG